MEKQVKENTDRYLIQETFIEYHKTKIKILCLNDIENGDNDTNPVDRGWQRDRQFQKGVVGMMGYEFKRTLDR